MLNLTGADWQPVFVDFLRQGKSRSPEPDDSESASVFRACARGCAQAAGEVLETARSDEHGAALAFSVASPSKLANCPLLSTAGSSKASTRSI
jgi:hypothetical protein